MVRPRAITLDVMMPHVDGWAVLTALKADPDLAKIPVVMVTFHDDNGLSATLGAADHVDKPVRWDKLKGVMERFRDAEGDVLIVDDDPSVRERLRATLLRQGWSVVEAANGQEALVKVMHGPPARHPARPQHAGDGRLPVPARPAREAGLRRHPGHRVQRAGHLRP